MHSTTSLLPTPVASVEAIRARFPALQREQRHEPVAYFDGPGGTQVPRDVVEAMSDYLYNHNANTHWAYPTSQETDLAIARSRIALADFLVAQPVEIAFGANMMRHWYGKVEPFSGSGPKRLFPPTTLPGRVGTLMALWSSQA